MTSPVVHAPDSSAKLAYWLTRVQRFSLLVGVIGAALCALTAYKYPDEFYPAYLVSFLFWLGLSLGALGINMLHHLTGGGWGIPIRRILESATGPFVLMALLFLPIVLGMSTLFLWSHADVVAADALLQRKVRYLNVDDFYIRAAIYFAIWIVWSLVLNRGTATADSDLQAGRQRPLAVFSGPGLILWGLSVTFAATDWGMSLDPHWFSSMYGVLFIGGQAVSALALSIIAAVLVRRVRSPINVLTTARLHDLGNFLLAFVMFWSYVSFMQFLIIWSANLPEETPWYLQRSHGGWQAVVVALMLIHFLLPFMLLLVRQMKRNGTRIVAIASLLLVMRVVDLSWLVLPTFTHRLWGPVEAAAASHGGAPEHVSSFVELWPLLVTLPAVGGLWIAVFTWKLSARCLIPVHEFPDIEETRHEPAANAGH